LKLKSLNSVNAQIRALSYQLYENNGVVKREEVLDIIKKMGQDERKTLRNLGVKFGRYHIFLFKLFKPSVVSLRILLWKNFNGEDLNLLPPTFGLNFVNDVKYKNKKFMLLCGFEKFDNFFVRIDILERLFIEIINSSESKSDKVKLIPKMLNLLGCNKESFVKVIKLMGYKVFDEKNETFFKYKPFKKIKKSLNLKINKDNPFEALKQLDLK
jgi:ATP-dependent RNA helicase SUPV3L1/SUV3